MTSPICKTCMYRVPGTHGDICEKTGKHLYWNQQTCPDYSEIKPTHDEYIRQIICATIANAVLSTANNTNRKTCPDYSETKQPNHKETKTP